MPPPFSSHFFIPTVRSLNAIGIGSVCPPVDVFLYSMLQTKTNQLFPHTTPFLLYFSTCAFFHSSISFLVNPFDALVLLFPVASDGVADASTTCYYFSNCFIYFLHNLNTEFEVNPVPHLRGSFSYSRISCGGYRRKARIP